MVVGMLLVDDVESILLLAIAWQLQAPNPRVNGEEEQDVIIPEKCEICSNTNNVANSCSETMSRWTKFYPNCFLRCASKP